MPDSNHHRDPVREYGIAHFTQKYGIKPNAAAHVKVAAGRLKDHVVSWRDTDYGEVPFFEKLPEGDLVEHDGNTVQVNYDLFHAVGRCLCGHLENLAPEEKKQIAPIPFIDIYEKIVYDALRESAENNGRELKPKPLWPEEKKFAVCLTHDIDEVRKSYQYFTKALIHLKKGKPHRSLKQIHHYVNDKATGHNPCWTFERMLALEESMGVKSSSYFLQEDAAVKLHKPGTWRHHGRRYEFNNPRIVQVMKAMRDNGWEVGLHGSFNSYKDTEKLKKEKHDLENALGHKVTGIRQHNLNLSIPGTWHHQSEAGLEHDTTLGSNHFLGFRAGTSFPFHPFDASTNSALPILEIPLAIEDIVIGRLEDPWHAALEIIESVERVGGVLTLLWHHTVFNDRDYPGYTDLYRKIIKHCKQKNAWIATGAEINKHWRSR